MFPRTSNLDQFSTLNAHRISTEPTETTTLRSEFICYKLIDCSCHKLKTGSGFSFILCGLMKQGMFTLGQIVLLGPVLKN